MNILVRMEPVHRRMSEKAAPLGARETGAAAGWLRGYRTVNVTEVRSRMEPSLGLLHQALSV